LQSLDAAVSDVLVANQNKRPSAAETHHHEQA